MDNASKALVMAGAILIAVMLISLGVYLFNVAKGQAEGTGQQLQTFQVESYNSRYTSYFGKNKSLAEVQSLVSLVNSHNHNQTEVNTYGGMVTISATNIVNGTNNSTYYANGNNARSSGFYEIYQTGTDSQTGCINEITIAYSNARQAD